MNDFTRAIDFIFSHQTLLWTKTLEHLELSGAAIGVAIVIALPLGLWLGHLHRGSFLAISVGNVGRALPSLAMISIGLGVLGIGFLNVMVALIVLAVPILLTNAYLAIDEVDREVVEAARGVGMSALQVFTRVELPLGIPLLFAGLRTAAVYVISTATLAAIAGGGGLGDIIANQASYRFEGVLGAALWVTTLALSADLAFGALQFALTPRDLRGRAAFAPAGPGPAADPHARGAWSRVTSPSTETMRTHR
jgi:osmoprotectant transport system permease protein